MIHVVIPAAGNGRRFVEAGYGPKIFASVDGVPMLRRVVDNIREHISLEHRVTVVTSMTPPDLGEYVEVIQLSAPTRGAVETVLAAKIDGDQPLFVANCDQLLGKESLVLSSPAAGWVGTFPSTNPHHSYVQYAAPADRRGGVVLDVAEKAVISDQAVSGIYFFTYGADFVEAAEKVLAEDRRVLGEFYVSTVLSQMIRRGLLLRTFDCPVDILGTPEELEAYHARSRA